MNQKLAHNLLHNYSMIQVQYDLKHVRIMQRPFAGLHYLI